VCKMFFLIIILCKEHGVHQGTDIHGVHWTQPKTRSPAVAKIADRTGCQ